MKSVPPTPDPQPLARSVLIIGIGSPFADDAAGLEAARRLESAELPAGARVIVADRPGVDLIDMLDGVEAVILIDAVRSGGRPGEVHDLNLAEISALAPHLVSSHGLGLGEAIELARRLGRMPACGRVLGIEVSEHVTTIEQPLSEPISAAVDDVVRRAVRWATLFTTEIARTADPAG
jgi:hydrogenase maturation protease